jgi:hypothetical protein
LPQTGFRFLSKFFRFIASPNIPWLTPYCCTDSLVK